MRKGAYNMPSLGVPFFVVVFFLFLFFSVNSNNSRKWSLELVLSKSWKTEKPSKLEKKYFDNKKNSHGKKNLVYSFILLWHGTQPQMNYTWGFRLWNHRSYLVSFSGRLPSIWVERMFPGGRGIPYPCPIFFNLGRDKRRRFVRHQKWMSKDTESVAKNTHRRKHPRIRIKISSTNTKR